LRRRRRAASAAFPVGLSTCTSCTLSTRSDRYPDVPWSALSSRVSAIEGLERLCAGYRCPHRSRGAVSLTPGLANNQATGVAAGVPESSRTRSATTGK
jgi:hypothetical protein